MIYYWKKRGVLSMAQETIKSSLKNRSNPRAEYYRGVWKRLQKNVPAVVGGILILLFIIIALVGPLLTTKDPNEVFILNKLQPPSADHWFGTDNFGRDIFTRIIHGMGITLYVGFFSVAIGGVIGVLLGVVSGYYGGKVDTIIMRLMDVLLAFPGILLALAIVSVLGGSLTECHYRCWDLLGTCFCADCSRFYFNSKKA